MKAPFYVFKILIIFTFLTQGYAEDISILVQSTTSTQNSGLYDYLLPLYEKKSGINVKVVAVGTGQAIKNASKGDADVLLVHSKKDEEKFVDNGYGVERFDLMYNDFVIIGPNNDPAKIKESKSAVTAFKKIALAKATFVSRGDDSGTHKKELSIWKESGISPQSVSGSWYREAGSGMGATLNTAVGMRAYTLADRATWISFANKGNFTILTEDDPTLFNQYGVIVVNPKKYPHVKYQLANNFVDWLLSKEGQQAIANFTVNSQQLFYPNAKEKYAIKKSNIH